LIQISRTEETSDLAFPISIRFYQLELDFKTKSIDRLKIMDSVVQHLLKFDEERTAEIEKFFEFLDYPDFLVDFLQQCQIYISTTTDRNDLFVENIIFLLNYIGERFSSILENGEISGEYNMSTKSKVSTLRIKETFEKFLISFLSVRLTTTMTKKMLTSFESFYPILANPPILADYVTRCYDSSNLSISLLALHSLFKLMTGYDPTLL